MPDKTPRRPWTAADDARLAELKAQGATDTEAALDLGRTTEAVTSHRHWLREQAAKAAPAPALDPAAPLRDETMDSLGRRAWTPSEDKMISDLRRQDETDEVIAAALGRSVAAVQGRACRLRLQGDSTIRSRKRPAPLTPAQVDEVRELHAQGLTTHQIAARLGTYATAVGRVVRPGRRDDEPDHTRTALALEAARAALARAQARHREAMETILGPVREAMHETGLIDLPTDDAEEDAAYRLVDHLRRRGVEMRRMA